MENHGTSAQWYLVQTKPYQDARAEENLVRQGYRCFRPQKPKVNTSRSRNQATESLFPGYLFIQLSNLNDNWYPIRSTRGVNRVVSFGNQPTPVNEEIILHIHRRLEAPITEAALLPGDTVRVTCSEGMEMDAVFLSSDGTERAVILLRILQREHQVRVPLTSLSLTSTPITQWQSA